jgi:hypothetical protein
LIMSDEVPTSECIQFMSFVSAAWLIRNVLTGHRVAGGQSSESIAATVF